MGSVAGFKIGPDRCPSRILAPLPLLVNPKLTLSIGQDGAAQLGAWNFVMILVDKLCR